MKNIQNNLERMEIIRSLQLRNLTEDDINTLIDAFRESLLDTIKLKNIEKHIR